MSEEGRSINENADLSSCEVMEGLFNSGILAVYCR
jgi:hypothetical protein